MKNKIPQKAGIGLRAQHYQYVMNNSPDVPWFEVHTENFFAQGGITHHILQKVRNDYPISFHGVGMSLGSLEGLSKTHLQKTKELVDKFQPALVSEHISWSEIDGVYMNDLLPVPYTKEATDVLVRNINQMQDFIGRQILVENPSSYLEFLNQEMPEYEFINTVIEKSGCGLLLDINNIYVSSHNQNFDAEQYLKNINHSAIGEIHLAGYSVRNIGDQQILIDTHGDKVHHQVWDLYKKAIELFGKRPTLIEWDTDIPEFEILQEEAKKAEEILHEKYPSSV